MTETTYPAGPAVGMASLPHRSTIYALALGTFAVGTEGFMIAALLPNIAGALRVSVPADRRCRAERDRRRCWPSTASPPL